MFRIETKGQQQVTVVEGATDDEVTSLKRLQHPNILKYVSMEKGVMIGSPACLPLDQDGLDIEEVLLGLRDICGAFRTRLDAKMYFARLSKQYIGTALSCHPLREHRWVLVRLPSSPNANETTSLTATRELLYDILGLLWDQVPEDIKACFNEEVKLEQFMQTLDAALMSHQLSLASALNAGEDLPLQCATDPTSLSEGYNQIEEAMMQLVAQGKIRVVEKRLLNWILTPEHVSQTASYKLLTSIFALPLSIDVGRMIIGSLVKQCLLSSDPVLNSRLHSFMGVLGPHSSTEILSLMVLSCHFNVYMLACAINKGWLDPLDLRYSCSVIRAMSALAPELLSRSPPGFVCEELVKDLQYLLTECSVMGDETDTDMLKLIKEVLVLLMHLSASSTTAQAVVSSAIATGCVLHRDHLIHIVNGCLSTLPIDPSFLLAVYSRMAGCQERTTREAACEGLKVLKMSLRLSIPTALTSPPSLTSTHFAPQGDSFLQCVSNFPQLASRYAPGEVGTLAQLSKIHQKVRPPQSHSNIVFRRGRDPPQYVVLLPIGNV